MHKNLLVCLRRRGRLPSAPATLLGQYASRRMIGSGYEGAREAGYDAAAMNELRALKHDQPFFMLNLLKVTDVDAWMKYCDLAQAAFETCGAHARCRWAMRRLKGGVQTRPSASGSSTPAGSVATCPRDPRVTKPCHALL